MLNRSEANKLRGLIARHSRCERALWALNQDFCNGLDFGKAYSDKVHDDLKASHAALFGELRKLTTLNPPTED